MLYKSTKLLFTGLALTAALASCSRAIVEEEVNPLYNPETNEVMTDFVFNVAAASNANTRMWDAAVQETGKPFRGIDNAHLYAYNTAENEGKIVLTELSATKEYDLSQVASPNSLSATNSRRVIELALPIGTNQLLFYGKAVVGSYTPPENNEQFITAYDHWGHLGEYSMTEEAGSAKITLGNRLNDDERFHTFVELFSGVLSIIMRTNLHNATTGISADAAPTGVAATYKFDVPKSEITGISWESYKNYLTEGSPFSAVDSHVYYPLEEKLGNAYKQMTTIRSADGELRAASSEAILRIVQDLWTIINEVRSADPLNKEEAVAKYLANEIFIKIGKFFAYQSVSDGGPVTGVSYSGDIIPNFKTALANFDLLDETAPANEPRNVKYFDGSNEHNWPDSDNLDEIANMSLSKFPFTFNLPRGATHMAWNSARKIFYYPDNFNTNDMGGTPSAEAGGAYNAKSYYYPAELLYFGNSPIRTSSKDKKVTEYPNGATDWVDNDSWNADWEDNASVKAATHAVAMKYNINYGVAMLKTRIKYGAATLEDNNQKIQEDKWNSTTTGEKNKSITVSASSFRLTGIIIGGQPTALRWDHLPKPGCSTGFIFDKDIESPAIPKEGYSDYNNTLVFDNFKGTLNSSGIWVPAAEQDVVYIALELQNCTGEDFYGNFNLIRDEGYFYLIGALKPSEANNLASVFTSENYSHKTDGYVIPPYAADGKPQNIPRVFMQDFKTTVNITLDKYALQAAYLTVPDLRSGSMTLGLSVDLEWEQGLDFDLNVGETGYPSSSTGSGN